MDFEELKRELHLPPDEQESNWHRHENRLPNPHMGGWVQNTATVGPMAYIDSEAIVSGDARVEDSCSLYHHARISGNAILSRGSTLQEHANASGNARIENTSDIAGHSIVTDNALISESIVTGNSRVSGNGKIIKKNVHDIDIGDDIKLDGYKDGTGGGLGAPSHRSNYRRFRNNTNQTDEKTR